MSTSEQGVDTLTAFQCGAILKLGLRGPGANFDPVVMSSLLTLGLVEIRSLDRRLVLTESGRRAYADLNRNLRDDLTPLSNEERGAKESLPKRPRRLH